MGVWKLLRYSETLHRRQRALKAGESPYRALLETMELTNTKLTLQLINDKNKVATINRRLLHWFAFSLTWTPLCWCHRCGCCLSSTVSRETWRGWRLTSWNLWSLVLRSRTCSSRNPPLSRKPPIEGQLAAGWIQGFVDCQWWCSECGGGFFFPRNTADKPLCLQ